LSREENPFEEAPNAEETWFLIVSEVGKQTVFAAK